MSPLEFEITRVDCICTVKKVVLNLQPLLFNSNSRLNGTGDIICNNGVIQPIDTVLLPPVVDTMNIAEVLLTRDADFKDLFLAFMLSNLTSLIESSCTLKIT